MTSPVCIIIPCYNEADRLPGSAFLAYQQAHPDVSFCFVNDGSRDQTAEVLATLQRQNPAQIDVLNLAQNQGKAGAVRAGMLHSVQKGHDYLGYFDADLATPLAAINDLRLVLDNHPDCVFVMGSRIKHLGVNIQRNAFRHYVGRIIATIISLILKLPVYDTQCGAKLLRREVIGTIFRDPFISPWLFDVELLARLVGLFGRPNLTGKLLEEPLQEWIEQADSRLSPTYMFRMWTELYRIYRTYSHLR
ncbi:dolichyl-phosphate beta-glucosyltransferase [Fibrivirga algicola]|uniref:dolichyl-phosphate beta-glucosyltransferase n=1 Tax=Fibrivirga algicola TaxID=2950420 RepID=A0ABX0QH76_9BACT|nr:dolichyl-phosphate beta-glucosyltransferase [Fibrivirga algicola]NID11769.1 glycosyltransferase family 2 protein [Fibrivirga algicola]